MRLRKEACLLFLASCLLTGCGGGTSIGGGTTGRISDGSSNISLSVKSLTFSDQVVNTVSPPSSITLTNSGTASLSISSIAASSSFAQTNNCGVSVAAGAACTIDVSFTPTASGPQTGTITVADNASGSPQTVSLTGTGISASAVILSPLTLAFSSQTLHTISAAQNITLTNTGGTAIAIAGISAGGANSGDFVQTNTCGSSVVAGASCTISVQFQPSSTGTRTASILVSDSAEGSPQTAGLSGTVRNPIPYLQQPLSPMTVAPEGLGLTLTLRGAGFVSGSSVLWNGSSRVVTFVNANELQAYLLPSDIAIAGTAQVTVMNPAPGGGKSNPRLFQVTTPSPSLTMSATVLAVGTDPRGIIVADFNGDGKSDIAVVNRGTNTVSILLGNGNGTFSAVANYATGVDPVAVAAGDFNGDGKLDLVTTNRASYTVSLLLGNGDGTFGAHVDYVAGTEPIAAILGDFNDDGYLDVAEANSADNTVSVFLGVGDGTLRPAVVYAVGPGPIAIVTGDLNSDGILDLATASSGSDNVSVLLGNGNGTFQSAANYGTGSDPDGLFTADLNGDGKLDLVAANNGGNTVSVLLNSGDGTFAPNVAYPVGSLPFAVAGGDFYGNGKVDLAVVNSGSNNIAVVPGNGDGTFNTGGSLTFGVGNDALAFAVADFNLDGRLDLVVSNSEDNTISVLLQTPVAALSAASVGFGSQTIGSSSASQPVVLSNTGSATLGITTIAITGLNSSQFSQTNNCGASLAAGANCTVNLVFSPTVTGTLSANLTITDNASGSPQNVGLVGTGGSGTAPAVTLSPGSLVFANQSVGTTSASSIVTLTNSGNATLTLSGISITGTNSGDFAQTNNCGASLAAGISCTLNVTFTPTASGARQASVSVSDNAAGSPQTVSLTGTGTAPVVSFSASNLTFGNQAVGTSSPASGVTLFNIGNASLSISSITITGANPGDFSQSNTCGATVAAASNCTINAVFGPTASGTRTAAISVADNATGSPQLVTLTGTGTNGNPAATISPLSLSFGSQNLRITSPGQTVTLTNTGGASLSITSIVASGDYSQTNTCGTSLAAAAKCTVTVTFNPSWTGSRSGYITFSDNAAPTMQTVTLSGTGTAPSSTVSISPLQASLTPEQSEQFQASISGVASSKVTWAVDGITGGSGSVGTISSSGLYTAPSAAGAHTVTATSTANTSQSASVPVVVTTYAGTFVYHNDNGRTGQNLTETVLTTGNVNSTQFGKLFSYPVDGQIYGEPLYVSGVSVSGQGTHNVVYVVTENDSVYAFDADGITSSPLWQVSFLTGGAQTLNTTDIGGCSNISPQVGITSTPVIDPVSNTIFVLARTKLVSGGVTSYYQTLYAIDITSGAIRQSVQIQASVSSTKGAVSFNSQTQNQRAGLFLLNGLVYIAWAAHCDIQPYHGWLMGYEEGTLQQAVVYNTTPNGVEGGIWQSGAAPAVDEFGNIYVSNGNGTFDVNAGGVDYGEGLEKLSVSGSSLLVEDYFVPSNYQTLNASDLDLGSGGPLLIPTQTTSPTEMLVVAGKQGMVYLINQTNLGQYNANGNEVIQTLPAGTVPTAHSSPAYWENNIYFCGVGNNLQSYLLSNGLLSTSPTSTSPDTYGYPGATPAVSANGSTNGMVWALQTVQNFPAILRVYDAANVSRELYTSNQSGSRDQAGIAVKFAVPTVANGKVYIGTSSELDVYGLLPVP